MDNENYNRWVLELWKQEHNEKTIGVMQLLIGVGI